MHEQEERYCAFVIGSASTGINEVMPYIAYVYDITTVYTSMRARY